MKLLEVADFRWHRDIGVLTRRAGARSPLAQDFMAALLEGPPRRFFF